MNFLTKLLISLFATTFLFCFCGTLFASQDYVGRKEFHHYRHLEEFDFLNSIAQEIYVNLALAESLDDPNSNRFRIHVPFVSKEELNDSLLEVLKLVKRIDQIKNNSQMSFLEKRDALMNAEISLKEGKGKLLWENKISYSRGDNYYYSFTPTYVGSLNAIVLRGTATIKFKKTSHSIDLEIANNDLGFSVSIFRFSPYSTNE